MKFSGKMWLMIVLKVTKNQGFTLSLENTFLEKPQGCQIDPTSALLGLSAKYIQKRLDHAKQSSTDAFKSSSKRVIHKTAEATGDLIGNKIPDRITNISKTSQQNNSETVTNDRDKEILKERHISPEQRQKIIDDLGLI